MIYVRRFCFEAKWSYGDVFGDKSAMYNRVDLFVKVEKI